jgi:carboxymethylenebutenolidase
MRTFLATSLCAATLLVATSLSAAIAGSGEQPERVTFLSADGQTMLVGYVFAPPGRRAAQMPAVVMMHGRAGAYSSRAAGVYDATTLSQRHQAWGNLWAERGYLAIMVDGFGPRGYPQGFARHSYDSRPAELDEVTVRPLDAYGALNYLRSRSDVAADSIGLMGWSNGGSATLSALAVAAPGIARQTPESGFRAALVFYAGCHLKGRFDAAGYRPYAPVRVFHGTADKETSARVCDELVERSRTLRGDIRITLFPGATHSFDDPGDKRQSNPANAEATDEATRRAVSFFDREIGGR